MALSDIKRVHVNKAIAEFNRLGDEEFLKQYGFKAARGFLLRRRQRLYPSKAIVGVAHGYATDEFWRHGNFSGGEATVANLLERKLGFEMVRQPYDNWPFYKRIGRAAANLGDRFSPWARWASRHTRLEDHLLFPGVYMIALARSTPRKTCPPPRPVIYIGETNRTLGTRLDEFEKAAKGKHGHSGGCTYRELHGSKTNGLCVAVVPVRLPAGKSKSAVSLLERYLIWLYSDSWSAPPECNSK